MLRTVEGVPGSGKTYYAVHYLLKHFFEYDEFYDEYLEKDGKSVLVISNIENLRIPHLELDILIERFGLEKFFTVENFERIQKQYRVKNIVLVIDEAQKYFPRKFFSKDVFYFFQYHRHLGVDVFLLTQSRTTLAKELVVLSEYIVRAVPRSSQPAFFVYHYFDVDGNKLFTRTLKKDSKVFRAYQSQRVEEVEKPKNVLKSHIFAAAVAFFVSISLIAYTLHSFFSTDDLKKVSQSQSQPQSQPQPQLEPQPRVQIQKVQTQADFEKLLDSAPPVRSSTASSVRVGEFAWKTSEYEARKAPRAAIPPRTNFLCVCETDEECQKNCYALYEYDE